MTWDATSGQASRPGVWVSANGEGVPAPRVPALATFSPVVPPTTVKTKDDPWATTDHSADGLGAAAAMAGP